MAYFVRHRHNLRPQANLASAKKLSFMRLSPLNTYSKDSNIVFNRISINEAGNFVAFELRTHLEALFTGTKARTGSATAIKNSAIQKLEQLRGEDIIVDGNESDGTLIPAVRNLIVTNSGVTATLDVTVTRVPGIDFILSTIFLTSLTASASA